MLPWRRKRALAKRVPTLWCDMTPTGDRSRRRKDAPVGSEPRDQCTPQGASPLPISIVRQLRFEREWGQQRLYICKYRTIDTTLHLSIIQGVIGACRRHAELLETSSVRQPERRWTCIFDTLLCPSWWKQFVAGAWDKVVDWLLWLCEADWRHFSPHTKAALSTTRDRESSSQRPSETLFNKISFCVLAFLNAANSTAIYHG